MIKDYYIEFYATDSNLPYIAQSKYFETPEKALKALINFFDYIDADNLVVFLMANDFPDYDNEPDEFDIVEVGRLDKNSYNWIYNKKDIE